MAAFFFGPFLIILASALWATDALFRYPTVASVNPTLIVFLEHSLILVAMLPWILFRRKEALSLKFGEWIAAAIIGIGGSAIATVFFTSSFRYINPSIAILLQKVQPVLCTFLAFIILGERPQPGIWKWALLAIASGIVLSFPDLNFTFLANGLDLHSRGVLYALIAASLWALATVAGKLMLKNRSPMITTFWRFVFGWGALLFLTQAAGLGVPWNVFSDPTLFKSIAYMAMFPGLLAMILYYNGLNKTEASVATLLELFFPVSAVVLNRIFLGAQLGWVQIISGSVLILSVTRISLQSRK